MSSRIRSGEYSPHQWLPAERTLATELGVHRRIVRAAIARLAEAGLLLCRTGCRPIVLPPPPATDAESSARGGQARAETRPAASRLVALIMWHGGFEQGATVQQRIFWGMNQTLAQAGYHGIFLDIGDEIGTEQQNAQREATRLRYALDHDFAGVVFYAYAYRRNRELIQEVARRVPLTLIDRLLPGIQADFVGVDNYQAMFEAASHLIALGHRRIAHVTTAEPINTVQDRLDGYRQALRQAVPAGLTETVVTTPADWTEWPVFETLFRLSPDKRPSAILCVSDYVAWQVASRLDALGLRIPDDVALVGFDDIVQTLPQGIGLSTVAQPFEEIGRAAAQAFLRRRASSGAPCEHIELPARLILRSSCGARPIVEPKDRMSTALVQNKA